jgi:hypothetical protein
MGKSSNAKILLFISVLILGIYVLPSAVAKYAGSHTWEVNESAGVTALQCGLCHTYIKNEITGAINNDTMNAHMNASNDSAYVGPGQTINISNTPTGSLDDVCWMCHIQELDATVSGGHTKVVIRVCTDEDCHGDQVSDDGVGSCEVFTSGFGGVNSSCNVTGKLNSSADAHWNFYRPLEGFNSTIGNEDGGNYGMGFVSCMACHTHVGLDLNITRPNKLSLSLNLISVTEGFNATSLTVNYTNMSSSVGGKEPGSVWS